MPRHAPYYATEADRALATWAANFSLFHTHLATGGRLMALEIPCDEASLMTLSCIWDAFHLGYSMYVTKCAPHHKDKRYFN